VLDLETTGLTRDDDIVSVGVLVDNIPYINFRFTRFIPVISRDCLITALEPLGTRDDLTIVGHNIAFDLGFLHREGIKVVGITHDTELILRLCDSDRGKNKDVLSARVDRVALPGAPAHLNYKLKHIVPQLLSLGMVDYPEGAMDTLAYEPHVQYLTSDLLGTSALYDHLLATITADQRRYYDQFVAPITPILVAMTEVGVRIDQEFSRAECGRLRALIREISNNHQREFGCALGMDLDAMEDWLFKSLGLTPIQYLPKSDQTPSLSTPHLRELKARYSDPRAARSIDLIILHRTAAQCLIDLIKLEKGIDWRDGKIHTGLRDTQASGRISSTKPNMQGVSRAKDIGNYKSIPRNALVSDPGEVLISIDIKQADVRVMAHHVATFPRTAQEHVALLRAERQSLLEPQIGDYLATLSDYRNPGYHSAYPVQPPDFDPARPCTLGALLQTAGGDPYKDIAAQITDVPVATITDTSPVRKTFKTVTLGMVNSITPTGLAKQLGYGDGLAAKAKAKQHMEDFWRVYPQVKLYTETMWWHVALTGETTTWAGRPRIGSAHKWMVSLPRVELLCSFDGGREWLDLDVIPIRPGRHCLTVWVRKAWDATYSSTNHGKMVYEDFRGPLCTRPYRLFQDEDLLYHLPVRNLGWRSIRRVRTDTEEAKYLGFDSTARGLVNSIYQGGTADISKQMLLRATPLCEQYGARLLLNIHDELVLTCPTDQVEPLATALKVALEQPPAPTFKIPIRVDVDVGTRFGELVPIAEYNK
jgi:DNA polymerase I-like protein with 3'-5' exonuclease and polymerase domains